MKKLTKVEIVENLRGMLVGATKTISEIINYTLKAYDTDKKSVTIADLNDTIQDIKEMMVPALHTAPIENQIKVASKVKPTDEELEQKIKDIVDMKAPKENELKKTEEVEKKKPENKKKIVAKKESILEVIKPQVVVMPKFIDSEVGRLKLRDDIKTISDLAKIMIEDETDLVACLYWSERDLRQYTYDPMGLLETPRKSFPLDLDIVDLHYASEKGIQATGVSIYTEVPFIITPQGFEASEDGCRFVRGTEYQIYEVLAEDEKEEEVVEDEVNEAEIVEKEEEEVKEEAPKKKGSKKIIIKK